MHSSYIQEEKEHVSSLFLFSTVLEFLTSAIKGIQIGKKIKLSLFTDNRIVYIENLMDSSKTLLELVSLANLQNTRPIRKNQLYL